MNLDDFKIYITPFWLTEKNKKINSFFKFHFKYYLPRIFLPSPPKDNKHL